MGCEFGDFLVVDSNGKKVQSGFSTIGAAHRYISKRRRTGRWRVARFTKKGIGPILPRLSRPQLPLAIRTEIRRRYTGKYGQQTALAREFGVSQTTVARVIG